LILVTQHIAGPCLPVPAQVRRDERHRVRRRRQADVLGNSLYYCVFLLRL
jgi:hypothetical protein